MKLHRTAITNKVGVQSVAELTQLWMEAFPKGSSFRPSEIAHALIQLRWAFPERD